VDASDPPRRASPARKRDGGRCFMRLTGLASVVVLLVPCYLVAQHSSGSGGSSSGSSSSGGASHSSSSGGSSYSGGGSSGHSSGGGHSSSGGSHASGSSHNSGSSHISNSSHNAKNDRGSNLTSTTRNGSPGSTNAKHPVHEPYAGASGKATAAEKRGLFSVLFHPFRKAHPKPEPKPALYLPRPICPRGYCAPRCPVGQVRGGGGCTTAVVPVCVQNQIWNGIDCGQSQRDRCPVGQIWNGLACVRGSVFVDHCFALRTELERQNKRTQSAASARLNACSLGTAQECSEANTFWQNEENLRQDLMTRYRQCQMQSVASYSGAHEPSNSMLWFDSLRFNPNF